MMTSQVKIKRSERKVAMMLRTIFDIPYRVQSDIEDIISALKSLFFFPLHMSPF
jgi:hypothetical protein